MKKEKKPPLNFRFHNPNSDETFIYVLVSAFMDANKKRLDEELNKQAEKAEKKNQDT